MKAPFVWFGGKRRVADVVWRALGDVDNYVEPFAGSLAVLLERPHRLNDGRRRAETVNDADHMIANFWRALAADPEAVAHHADWPVNEDVLFARHLWLVNEGRTRLVAGLEADPDWYDPKVAGWWVWGINAWIGSGWCSGTGPWVYGEPGKRPHLGDAGQGVNQPDVDDAWTSGGSGAPRNDWDRADTGRRHLFDYFDALAARLRDVRVCTGDWTRVVTRGALNYGTTVGVFLDPPYLGAVRTPDLYACDDHHIANDVRDWCLANGDNPRLRIVLAGYDDEHDHLIPDTWRRHRWSATGGYSKTDSQGMQNRHHEVLWFSPHCIDDTAPNLFGEWTA